MKGQIKKTISILLTACLLLSVLAIIPVSAETNETASTDTAIEASGVTGDCTWTIDKDGVLTISGEGAMADYDWEKKDFAPWYDVKDTITALVIEDGVTNVGNSAFFECDNIETAIIGEGVTVIGSYSFFYCEGLVDVTIGEGVTAIENHAFSDCTAIEMLYIPNSVTSIGDSAFSHNESLQYIVLSENITEIAYGAFNSCLSLEDIVIPEKVTEIGSYAFYNCPSLATVIVPASVTKINDNAFLECSAITDVYYDGTTEDWDKIEIGSGNDALLNADLHTPVVFGDTDGDGTVDSKDRIKLARHLARWSGYEEIDEDASDLNLDMTVDAKDRVILTRHLSRWAAAVFLSCRWEYGSAAFRCDRSVLNYPTGAWLFHPRLLQVLVCGSIIVILFLDKIV